MKTNNNKTAKFPPFFKAFDKTGNYTIIKIDEISHIRTVGKGKEIAIGLKNGHEFNFSRGAITELFSVIFPFHDNNEELADDAFDIIERKFTHPRLIFC